MRITWGATIDVALTFHLVQEMPQCVPGSSKYALSTAITIFVADDGCKMLPICRAGMTFTWHFVKPIIIFSI
jgi:hypothetical protein